MPISLSALLTGASSARGSYLEGQREGRAGQLTNALMMQKMQREEEQARLARTLNKAQVGNLESQVRDRDRPPVVAPRNKQTQITQDGVIYELDEASGWWKRAKIEGAGMPAAAGTTPSTPAPDSQSMTGDPALDEPPQATTPAPAPKFGTRPPAPRVEPQTPIDERMRAEIKTLVDGGMSLEKANAQVRAQHGQAPPAPLMPTIIQAQTPEGTPSVFRVPRDDGPAVPVEGISPRSPGGGLGAAAIKKAVAGNEVAVGMIDRAIAALKAHPSATGLKRGVPWIGEDINQRADPVGVEARALVANVGSAEIHDRTGANMTAKEEPRLMPFVPGMRDGNAAAIKKLELLREFAIKENAALQAGYAPAPAGGGRGGGGGGDENAKAAWTAKNPAQPGESWEAYQARYLKSKGGP